MKDELNPATELYWLLISTLLSEFHISVFRRLLLKEKKTCCLLAPVLLGAPSVYSEVGSYQLLFANRSPSMEHMKLSKVSSAALNKCFLLDLDTNDLS